MTSMAFWIAVGLLILSNTFMNFAWFGHLKANPESEETNLFIIILISWGIAFFEYVLMIPAIRMLENQHIAVSQMKILQEAISLSVFLPFSLFFIGEKFKWDYVWACCCIILAVFFIFREKIIN